MWNQVLDNALREPAARWESEKIVFTLAADYRKARKRRRRESPSAGEDMNVNEGPVLHHLCRADDLNAMAGFNEASDSHLGRHDQRC